MVCPHEARVEHLEDGIKVAIGDALRRTEYKADDSVHLVLWQDLASQLLSVLEKEPTEPPSVRMIGLDLRGMSLEDILGAAIKDHLGTEEGHPH